jgi:hypothetical protein
VVEDALVGVDDKAALLEERENCVQMAAVLCSTSAGDQNVVQIDKGKGKAA